MAIRVRQPQLIAPVVSGAMVGSTSFAFTTTATATQGAISGTITGFLFTPLSTLAATGALAGSVDGFVFVNVATAAGTGVAAVRQMLPLLGVGGGIIAGVVSAPQFINAGAGVGAIGTPIDFSLPAALVANDIMLLVLESANETATPPGGWVHVTGSPAGHGTAGSTTSTALNVFWKRHSGSETDPVSVVNAGNHLAGAIVGFRGCVTTGNPWSSAAFDVGSSGVTANIPSVTPTTNNLVVLLASSGLDASAGGWGSFVNSNLSGITSIVTRQSTSGNGGGITVSIGTPTTGAGIAIGASTVSLTSADWAGGAIALRPS